MRRALTEAAKILLSSVSFAIAVLAFIVLLGEPAPGVSMPAWQFAGMKVVAGAIIYGVYRLFLLKGKNGLLPSALAGGYRDIVNNISGGEGK